MSKGERLIVNILLFIAEILVNEVVRGDTYWEKNKIENFRNEAVRCDNE
jgi:hypothetical protein